MHAYPVSLPVQNQACPVSLPVLAFLSCPVSLLVLAKACYPVILQQHVAVVAAMGAVVVAVGVVAVVEGGEGVGVVVRAVRDAAFVTVSVHVWLWGAVLLLLLLAGMCGAVGV